MDIANIFCQSLGVNVPYGLPFSNGFGIRSKKIVIRSNSWGYPFEKIAIRSKKNLSTVRSTKAVCSKINFSRVSVPKPFRS